MAPPQQAFAVNDDTVLGISPRESDCDAYATSRRDAEAAIEDLDEPSVVLWSAKAKGSNVRACRWERQTEAFTAERPEVVAHA